MTQSGSAPPALSADAADAATAAEATAAAATSAGTSANTSASRPTRAGRAAAIALRGVLHAIAEVPLFVVVGLQISKGWVPTSDDAVIAWRSFNVLGGPLPLDGQFSQLSQAGAHAAFDIGPLQYFLLALPTHIDPVHGVLWGSAIIAAALAAVAIEAAWAAAGPVGGILASSGLALMAATLSESTVNLAWNPSIGVYAFTATMAAGVAVARGRLWWLPVAIATASLAIQSHSSFVLPSIAVVLVAVAFGIGDRLAAGRGDATAPALRPAGTALGVGLACFIAPLVQELTGHPGNWTVLMSNLHHLGRPVGIGVGLRGIASASALPPSWWVHVPAIRNVGQFERFGGTLYAHSEAWGITALALSATIAIGAALTRHRALAALAAMAALSGLAAAYTVGAVPGTEAGYLNYYLYFVFWPIGMAVLACFGLAIVTLARQVARRWANDWAHSAVPLIVAATVVLGAAGGALVVNDLGYGSSPIFLSGWGPIQMVSRTMPKATAVVAAHEGGGRKAPFLVEVTGGLDFISEEVDDSIAYELAAKGYPARVTGEADVPLGAPYRAKKGEAELELLPVLGGGLSVRWIPAGSHWRLIPAVPAPTGSSSA